MLYPKGIFELFLAVQEFKWPIISCFSVLDFLNNLLILGEAKAADAEGFVVCAEKSLFG